ncbi:uncharacterized protein LOC113774792 isoform X1 [Coffea eugenioides]|uniref:uncharacterized protein LOC113774792 isoform X1 n=1 Tax=Coffea eugenioides TaxID=49369 RepID=UPI000F60864C|nr:uncharacterized protein LOC113774792 isoform X1 [Coffea eugenioides]
MGNDKTETSIVCLSGKYVGLKATESGSDVDRRMVDAKLLEHNPLPQINEVKFCRHKLLRLAKYLRCAPAYFFTVDGKPTNLKVSQGDLMDSNFVASVDNNEVKVRRLKDGDVPRNRNGLDLEKIRDDANRGCYDWKMSGTISRPSSNLPHSSSSDRKRRGK